MGYRASTTIIAALHASISASLSTIGSSGSRPSEVASIAQQTPVVFDPSLSSMATRSCSCTACHGLGDRVLTSSPLGQYRWWAWSPCLKASGSWVGVKWHCRTGRMLGFNPTPLVFIPFGRVIQLFLDYAHFLGISTNWSTYLRTLGWGPWGGNAVMPHDYHVTLLTNLSQFPRTAHTSHTPMQSSILELIKILTCLVMYFRHHLLGSQSVSCFMFLSVPKLLSIIGPVIVFLFRSLYQQLHSEHFYVSVMSNCILVLLFLTPVV